MFKVGDLVQSISDTTPGMHPTHSVAIVGTQIAAANAPNRSAGFTRASPTTLSAPDSQVSVEPSSCDTLILSSLPTIALRNSVVHPELLRSVFKFLNLIIDKSGQWCRLELSLGSFKTSRALLMPSSLLSL